MYVKAYHITSKDNLQKVLSSGIYSRAHMEKSGSFRDIAAEGALNNHRYSTIDGHHVDEFARCFFNPLPPMYYMRKNEEDLCIIELHIPIIEVHKNYNGKDLIFHNIKIDGARWPYPRMFKESLTSHRGNTDEIEVHNLNQIHWDPRPSARDSENWPTEKSRRAAELAIFNHIPANYIKKVYRTVDEINSLESSRNLGKPEIINGANDENNSW